MENNRKWRLIKMYQYATYTDDMPIYVSIFERPKKPSGRPKTCKLSDEQKKKEQE